MHALKRPKILSNPVRRALNDADRCSPLASVALMMLSSRLRMRSFCGSQATRKPGGLKTVSGDLGSMTQKSPAVMFLVFMRKAPGCCCSHTLELLPTPIAIPGTHLKP